jgi:hypothetical protein
MGLALLLLLLAGGIVRHYLDTQTSEKALSELRLYQALQDELRSVRTQNGELRVEKLTLQGSVSQLQTHVNDLNAQQQRLLTTVTQYQHAEKKSGHRLLSAGSIHYAVGPRQPLPALAPDSIEADSSQGETLRFTYQSDTLRYQATVRGVRADSTKQAALQLTELSLPNEATVIFSWDTKRPGVPVAFSVSNSNPLFRVNGLESYAIPDLRPELVKPRGLHAVWVGLKQSLPYVVPALVAGGIGGVALSHR